MVTSKAGAFFFKGPSRRCSSTLVFTTSIVSASVGYWLLRRFRRRLNQSEVIRGRSRFPPNAAALDVGTYVCVRGTVSAGSRKLHSPLKGIPCVAYRLTTVRVVDSRSARRKASVTTLWGMLQGLSYVAPWLLSIVSSAQVDSERWNVVYQPISVGEEKVEIYLEEEDESVARLEAVAQMGSGKRRPRVRVDLAGAEFFEMNQVATEFKAEQSSASGQTSRNHLGYRMTEEVLEIGSKAIVLGEVRPDYDGLEGDVVLQRATPRSMFDLKTTSITRPFVVSTKSDQALLQHIERSGRIHFFLALPVISVGLVSSFLGTQWMYAAMNTGRAY